MDDLDLKSYKKNGYLIFKNFIPKDTVQKVLEEAKNIFALQFVHKNYKSTNQANSLNESDFNELLFRLFKEDVATLTNCGKQIQHLISLHRLSLDSKIENLLHKVGLKFPNISTRPVLYFNHQKLAQRKVFYKVDPHQDWRSMQGSLNSVVIWMPLVDVDKQLGALEVVPGSHLDGLRTDHVDSGFGMVKTEEDDKFVPVELEQGDILLFSSFLIHQSGENVTDKPRWSCHFRYNDLSESTFIERNFAHPYIYKPQEELLTPGFPTIDQVQNIFG